MVTIRGGMNITGVSIGGSGGDTRGWASTSVKGRDGRDIPIKFQPGADLPIRQVQIGGGMMTTLMAGSSTSMNVNGLDVRSQGKDLWVNGQKVDFTGGAAPAAPVDQGAALAALEKRFPGVHFTGAEYLTIDAGVSIAAGARIDGVPPGVQILGSSSIGATAHVSGGTLDGSRVDGVVSGGNLTRSTVEQGGRVDGGSLAGTTVQSGGRVGGGSLAGATVAGTVTGGSLAGTTVEAGAVVKGGSLAGMTIGAGAVVSGGSLQGFTLPPGEVVKGGSHVGRLNQGGGPSTTGVSIRGGSFSGDVNVVLGNVSRGVTVVGDVVGGVVIGDNVVVNQSFGDVGEGVSIVGLKIDRLG